MSDTEQPKDVWEELRKPFPKEAVGQLPKPYKRDSPKGNCKECGGYHGLPAVHLDFVGHANITDRLNTVLGPNNWTWEPLAYDDRGLPQLDSKGNLWIKLMVRETTDADWTVRLGYGDGSDSMKELIGDALRNAAMRFGIALDLWTKDELESTLADPSMKNDKPSARPSIAGSKSQRATKAQITEMLKAAKQASGLEQNGDVIAWFENGVGKPATSVRSDEVSAVLDWIKTEGEGIAV